MEAPMTDLSAIRARAADWRAAHSPDLDTQLHKDREDLLALLDAANARVEELERDYASLEYRLDSTESRLSALQRENEGLRKALEPFAKAYGYWHADKADRPLVFIGAEHPSYGSPHCTVADLRAAREAIGRGD